MLQITAIFRTHRLEQVERSLLALAHLPGFTVQTAHGCARGHGADRRFVADEWNPDQHDQIVLTVFCSDEHAESIVAAIRQAAYTGHPGDGIIALSNLIDLVRIRTSERGNAAC